MHECCPNRTCRLDEEKALERTGTPRLPGGEGKLEPYGVSRLHSPAVPSPSVRVLVSVSARDLFLEKKMVSLLLQSQNFEEFDAVNSYSDCMRAP